MDVFAARFYMASCLHMICLHDPTHEAAENYAQITHKHKADTDFNFTQYFDYRFYFLHFDFRFNMITTLGKPISLNYDYTEDFRMIRRVLGHVASCFMAGVGAIAMAVRALSSRNVVAYSNSVDHFRNIARAYSIPESLAKALENFFFHARLTTNSIFSNCATLLAAVPTHMKMTTYLSISTEKLDLDQFTMEVPLLERFSFEVNIRIFLFFCFGPKGGQSPV